MQSNHIPSKALGQPSLATFPAPACPSCGRVFQSGMSWAGANFCRGLLLLAFIKNTPGLSAWELSQTSEIPYDDAKKGLDKLRDYDAVSTEREELEGDRFRYRYSTGSMCTHQRFLDAMSRAEAMP